MAADPALVVSLEARLNKFEKQLKDAGAIADREVSGIEDRFARANPTFAGSFLGNFLSSAATTAIDSAARLVSELKDRFIDLRDTAHLVGISMEEAFGIQKAASDAKVPVDDVTKSIRGLATLLDQMKRGEENSLSKLLDVNPAALQGVNRDALTLQDAFRLIADLTQNADTNIQKLDVAKAAGQAETMVRFLEKGGAAITDLSKAATDAAPNLQKLADQAQAFDDAWRAAVTNAKAYLSENLFDFIRTDLVDLISLLEKAVSFLNLFKGGLIDTTAAASNLDKFRGFLQGFQRTQDQRALALLEDPNALSGQSSRPTSGATGGGTSTRDASRPITNIPLKDKSGGSEAADSFERVEEQIRRHTASVQADTIAVSLNNAAQAQLRSEFQLLNAARRDGDITEEQLANYTRLRESMSALQALDQAGIALAPARRQAFIEVSEAARGSVAAFDSARDAVQKLNSASSQIGSALSTAFADAVVEGKKFSEVMDSLLKTLEKAAINSVFSSLFNAPSSGGLSPFAGLFKGIIPGFAGGTDYAPGGLAWVGERGPELVNLPRGAQVVPNDVVRANSGSSVSNVFHVAGDVSQDTINRLQRMIMQTQNGLSQTNRMIFSAQRMQATGVG